MSCKSDDLSFKIPAIDATVAELAKEQSDKNVLAFMSAVNDAYLKAKDKSSAMALLEKAYGVAMKYELKEEANSYTMAMLQEDFNSAQSPGRILSMAKYLKSKGKIFPSDILLKGLVTSFPNSDEAKDAKQLMAFPDLPSDTLLHQASKQVFNANQINEVKAKEYIDYCEAYALTNPASSTSPEYLFKAAEIARNLTSYHKCISLYTSLIKQYPKYEKAAVAMFLKAFILDTQFKDLPKAKAAYEEFLSKYPDNNFAKDARFLLENLGKDPEQILKESQGSANQK